MNLYKLTDAIHGAEYVHVSEDWNLLIVWQGAGIFNVYNLETLEPTDCWTTDGAPGPKFSESEYAYRNSREANHGEAIRWAQAECEEWLNSLPGVLSEES